ncbi:MAG: ATP-dependent DNA helicase [Methyloligellaceae bacterium]
MKWSPQQDDALSQVSSWLKDHSSQVFRLFGYAGTGKTTLAKHLAQDVDGDVLFGAFTGKAAYVLRAKGCEGASTIHSMIYRPEGGESEGDSPIFAIKRDCDAAKASLIIIDECSMVDEELGRDLLSFGNKVLVLGDPAQLPPVKGGGFFTEAEPDIMLTEVHRQAADNPIIAMSMDIREGKPIDYGTYGESRVIPRSEIDSDDILRADQVLVGTNKTRRQFNGRIRELRGYEDLMPSADDKLVCLRNDKSKGLLNGGIWTVKRLNGMRKNLMKMELSSEDDQSRKTVKVNVHPFFFEGKEHQLAYSARRKSDEFDYGYALTVHKAQGSQWDDVVLFDQSGAFREHQIRWLYTAVTRAAERITIVA